MNHMRNAFKVPPLLGKPRHTIYIVENWAVDIFPPVPVTV